MSSLLKLGMASSVNQRKSWTFYRGLQDSECSAPLPAPLFPCWSSICPRTCLQPQQRALPSIWSGWLLPEDIAQALSSSRYLLSKLPHLLQISASISPWQWGLLWLPYSTLGYGPSTATHTVPMPSLHSFLSFCGTCGFPTSPITNWWIDWLILFIVSLFWTVIQVLWWQEFLFVIILLYLMYLKVIQLCLRQTKDRNFFNYTLILAINCKVNDITNLFLQMAKWFTHIT